MIKKSKGLKIQGRYFTWILKQASDRGGVWYADGRSGNRVNAGRHSLGSNDLQAAKAELVNLDGLRAFELGLADRSTLSQVVPLPIERGINLYLEHVRRPAITGGATKKTHQRYKAVMAKFLAFASRHHIHSWNNVDQAVLHRYAVWLGDKGYAARTGYLELTTIKQAIKWMIDESKLLPETCRPSLKIRKPTGTSTYCYTTGDIERIVAFCRERPELSWLTNVVLMLVFTGMRISELVSLRWRDVDSATGFITVSDESSRGILAPAEGANTTKNHLSRRLPIHPRLGAVLETLSRHADGRVLHGPRGGQLKPDTVRNILRRDVLEPLAKTMTSDKGMPSIKSGRLHSFRHAFCSMAATNGVSQQVLMRWLGHQDSKLIHHYYHLHDEESRLQIERLNPVDGPAVTLTGEPDIALTRRPPANESVPE